MKQSARVWVMAGVFCRTRRFPSGKVECKFSKAMGDTNAISSASLNLHLL